MADWQAIRAEYEAGASLRSLALSHDVPKTTLLRKRDAEKWARTGPLMVHGPDRTTSPLPASMPLDAVSIARAGLKQLALHLQGQATKDTLPIASHKSLSDALAQYVKVLITAPAETETADGLLLPLEKLLPSTRMEIRRLLAEDEQKQRERSAG